jgi:hypothetical protein
MLRPALSFRPTLHHLWLERANAISDGYRVRAKVALVALWLVEIWDGIKLGFLECDVADAHYSACFLQTAFSKQHYKDQEGSQFHDILYNAGTQVWKQFAWLTSIMGRRLAVYTTWCSDTQVDNTCKGQCEFLIPLNNNSETCERNCSLVLCRLVTQQF